MFTVHSRHGNKSKVKQLASQFNFTALFFKTSYLNILSKGKKNRQLTSLHLLAVLRHVVWADGKEELDVIVTVILGHFFSIGFMRPLNMQTIEQEVVGHADSVGFHGMTLAIVVIPNIPWERRKK
uniref:Uncharacterized protein n=1 Tax=Sinocyclocheilus anshuiensis TaxID=1608454 RepID=A0A671LJG1_9TELE